MAPLGHRPGARRHVCAYHHHSLAGPREPAAPGLSIPHHRHSQHPHLLTIPPSQQSFPPSQPSFPRKREPTSPRSNGGTTGGLRTGIPPSPPWWRGGRVMGQRRTTPGTIRAALARQGVRPRSATPPVYPPITAPTAARRSPTDRRQRASRHPWHRFPPPPRPRPTLTPLSTRWSGAGDEATHHSLPSTPSLHGGEGAG